MHTKLSPPNHPKIRNSLCFLQKWELYKWLIHNFDRADKLSLPQLAEEASAELNQKFTISNCRTVFKAAKETMVV